MATRVGKFFLEIVYKNFTEDHPYSKVFNRKTLKVSYFCMPYIKKLIMAHNRKMENVIYRASVTTKSQTKFYIGSTGLSFKIDIQNTSIAIGMKNTVI